jgi:hypothetical protein
MGVSKRVCAANKIELKKNIAIIKRISKFSKDFPSMGMERRMRFTVQLNDLHEKNEMLRRNKNNSDAYEFTYVYKKAHVKNRKA